MIMDHFESCILYACQQKYMTDYLLAAREAAGKPACMLIPALSEWGWSWVTPTQASQMMDIILPP